MNGSFSLFRFVCKAALNVVGFGVAGDFVGDVLPDLAQSVYKWWVKDRDPSAVRDELAAVASVSDEEAKRLAARAVAEEAAFEPEQLQLVLASYLTQLPASVRQTQRRPADPSGRTIAANLTLRAPADVLALLPARPARFQKGQAVPGMGDWQLAELLGIGGFGEVWKATNPHLPPVALKFCMDPAAARSLRNEADLLGRVVSQGRHPGIVALQNTALSCDPPYLVYEYVPGGDMGGLVQQWLATPGFDRVAASLPVMRQLADAVAFAHRLSPPIVHRDLKPANILLSVRQAFQPDSTSSPLAVSPPGGERRGETASGSGGETASGCGTAVRPESLTYKIADFGIGAIVAQTVGLFGPTRHGHTMPTILRGSCTPLYASPQQMRGEPADPRDDVFALGVIWYQMLTGDLSERPGVDWREELEEVPSAVLDVLGRCLAARAERRLPNGAALMEALASLGDVQGRARVKSVVIVEAEAEEDDLDSDDPHDLAGQLQRSLAMAQRTLSHAVEMTEQRHDYAAAVRLLEGLPEAFRDNGFLDVVRARRDRVNELRPRIRKAVKANHFAGVRDEIEELLALTPQDHEMQQLRRVVPWKPGPEILNSIGVKLVLIPAGRFTMGSPGREHGRSVDEGPPHSVRLTQSFYLGAYPVTQEQYRRVMGNNPSHFRVVPGQDTRLFPIENVSWTDAVAFCRALSALPEERRLGRVYRLPTEAEWEYACRAGRDDCWPFSVGGSLTSSQANFDGRHPYGGPTRGDFLGRTAEVGSYEPNALGLHDMHGNVWEWCMDWYDADYYKNSTKEDPTGPATGSDRVLRGGSWQNHGRLCRSACRDRAGESYRSLNAGFRVVGWMER